MTQEVPMLELRYRKVHVEPATPELDEEANRRRVKEPNGLRLWTAWLRRKPDFLILGAQRAGTTSLFMTLLQHPDVAGPSLKEIHFFDRYYARGFGWYRAHFPPLLSRGLTGEASPSYLFHPLAAKRAATFVPRAKLIALLRDPVDRAYSQYQMNRRNGVEPLSFEEAIRREEERTESEGVRQASDELYFGLHHRRYSYLARGRYAEQLERWLVCYPRTQLLIVPTAKLRSAPHETLNRVYAFLGLNSSDEKPMRECNVARYDPLSGRTRQWLTDYFRPHYARLSELLGQEINLEGIEG